MHGVECEGIENQTVADFSRGGQGERLADRDGEDLDVLNVLETRIAELFDRFNQDGGADIVLDGRVGPHPADQIPLIQKKIIRTCIERRRPVIVATQMLHSMIESPRPTRAEVSDVANACIDRADALMLSGETANGRYPEIAVRTMVKIIEEVEGKDRSFFDVPYSHEHRVTAYLAKAAVKAALRLDTKAIVADSVSGKAILALSAYRGLNPIFAQVYDRRVARQLALSYGVYATHIENGTDSEEALSRSICQLINDRRFSDEDLIIVLAGSFGANHGASYIEIASAEKLRRSCGLPTGPDDY